MAFVAFACLWTNQSQIHVIYLHNTFGFGILDDDDNDNWKWGETKGKQDKAIEIFNSIVFGTKNILNFFFLEQRLRAERVHSAWIWCFHKFHLFHCDKIPIQIWIIDGLQSGSPFFVAGIFIFIVMYRVAAMCA